MKKILITGGAGFVGSNLADRLIDDGYGVVVVDNLYSGKKEYVNPQAKFYKQDICSEEIEKIFKEEKPDFVFHLAAQIEVPRSVEEPEFDNKVNALGSLNIFKNCVSANVKKVIFFSTGGALYGDCDGPATEEKLISPVSPYAIHKYTAERYLEMFRQENNLNYAVLRPANIYGPRQYKGGECGVIGIFTSNAINNLPSIQYGDGSKTRDYVYVDDVVEACVSIMNSEKNGVFNIGTSREINNLDVIKIIENITGKKFDYEFAKDKPGEVKRSVLNCDKIKKAVSWESKVKLEDGIKKTISWIKDN